MIENWKESLALVLKHEGGFVNHPSDPGGVTNLGCTKSVWEEFCGFSVSVDEMKALTPADVAPLYKSKYWNKVKADELPVGVDYCVFDAAINSGPARAARWLQECCGTQPDGIIGPMTLQMAQSMVADDLINLFCDKRLAFLKALSTWDTFGKGWERRVEDVRSHAIKMADRL